MSKYLVLVVFIFVTAFSNSNAEIITVAPEYEERYQDILHELRCLVCQNQTLGDSNSELANDLRVEVKEMLESGASDKEIISFMSDRYGDFVLYKPPVKPRTFLLWFGPFLILLLGLIVAMSFVRKQAKVNSGKQLDADDQARLDNLLNDDRNK